ncbi:MAG TPA: hypothetical protein DIT18_04775 [Pseudomonas sp.]|nr:hypothetical protein [Pseudomonas sp.]
MKRLALVVMAGSVLAGCLDKSSDNAALSRAIQQASDVKVSAVSPDMAVKSWWALKDAAIKLDNALCLELVKSRARLEEKTKQIAGDSIEYGMTCSDGAESYERTIESVDVQSDTRAIVTASIKNVTPADPGASTDSSEQANKKKGSAFKYVLERQDSSSEWKVSKVSYMAFYSRSWDDAFKKKEPYNHIYVNERYQ